MHAQSIASPFTEAVPSWRPAPTICLAALRTWLDHCIFERFPRSNTEAYRLLDGHGYRPASDVAWELATNPTYSIALVRATHIRSGQSVKVPIVEAGFYSEIAAHGGTSYAAS